ncbi:Protein of unknown function [Pyronema omphalodes CBS 100304]|uniref:Uncharacterized protein n=1 Tax=Pyronema omphalodes (strain CBS 100304) TaxID=1076935 RepID=U4LK54_PYROM|nr:Protein of unknown function [Pyronema omphalodes CBS 100304]
MELLLEICGRCLFLPGCVQPWYLRL